LHRYVAAVLGAVLLRGVDDAAGGAGGGGGGGGGEGGGGGGAAAAGGGGGSAGGGARRALRSEMLRWHPDKFEARLGRSVRPADRKRVNARVNVVAQLVADLFKQTAAAAK
jgi:hypothetical protein